HAHAAEEAAGQAAESSIRTALAEAGRALALEPTNAAALRVVAGGLRTAPREIPAVVAAEVEAQSAARPRRLLREAIGIDLGAMIFMTPFALWMGVRSWGVVVASIVFTLLASAMKLLASRRPDLDSMFPTAYASYLCNVLALVCIGTGWGPLLFMPML